MIINVIDVADPAVSGDLAFVKDGPAIVLGGMCNGVGQMVSDVLQIVMSTNTKLTKLRIFSHGGSGLMQVSAGKTAVPGERAALDVANLAAVKSDLKKLKGCFGIGAIVELHGCNVAAGQLGDRLLQELADLWGVKVKAGILTQSAGAMSTQLVFEGPTKVAIPGGKRPLRQNK